MLACGMTVGILLTKLQEVMICLSGQEADGAHWAEVLYCFNKLLLNHGVVHDLMPWLLQQYTLITGVFIAAFSVSIYILLYRMKLEALITHEFRIQPCDLAC